MTSPTHLALVRDGLTCRVEERPTPAPGPGELLIAPEQVSLCGTDLQILRRDRDDPAPVVGHEGASRVVAAGEGVVGFVPGDRVLVNPTHPADPSFLLGHNVDGLFQQRVLIGASAVAGGLVSPLPEALPSGLATLVEPVAVVRYALECLAFSVPDSLLVVGDGLIGNLATAMARRVLGPDVPTTLTHRTREGHEWTAAFAPGTANVATISDALPHLGDRVALLVATHRPGTVPAVTDAVRTLGTRLVAVHPLGGVAPGATTPALPGIDLDGVRRANTGGPWPPAISTFRRGALRIAASGNRGVTSERLVQAAGELTTIGTDLSPLLTHTVGLAAGARAINELISTRSRLLHGELVMRLVVDVSRDEEGPAQNVQALRKLPRLDSNQQPFD